MNTLERKEQFTKAKMTLYTNEGHSEQRGCLDDDEKGTSIICTLGGSQELLIFNESGLYSLILRSRKP